VSIIKIYKWFTCAALVRVQVQWHPAPEWGSQQSSTISSCMISAIQRIAAITIPITDNSGLRAVIHWWVSIWFTYMPVRVTGSHTLVDIYLIYTYAGQSYRQPYTGGYLSDLHVCRSELQAVIHWWVSIWFTHMPAIRWWVYFRLGGGACLTW